MNKETNYSFYLLVGIMAIILNLTFIMGVGYFYSSVREKINPHYVSSSTGYNYPQLIDVDVSNFGKYRFINTIGKNPREYERRRDLIERLETVENEIMRLNALPSKDILLDSMLGRLNYLKNKNASRQYIYHIKN